MWGAIADGSVSGSFLDSFSAGDDCGGDDGGDGSRRSDSTLQWALGESLSRLETAYEVGELELPPGIEILSESSSESEGVGGLDQMDQMDDMSSTSSSSSSSSSLSASHHDKAASDPLTNIRSSTIVGYASSDDDDDYVFEG
jgi:hypothetical protein